MRAEGSTSAAIVATTHVPLPKGPQPIRDGRVGVRSPIKPPEGGWEARPLKPAPTPKPKAKPKATTTARPSSSAIGRPRLWDLDEAIRLSKEGMTAPDIARTVGAGSGQIVRRALERRGHEVAHGSKAPVTSNNAKLTALLAEGGATVADVRAWARANGIKVRDNGMLPHRLVREYMAARSAA